MIIPRSCHVSKVTGAVCTWEPAFRCLSYGEATLQLWPCATARAAALNGHTNLISKAEAFFGSGICLDALGWLGCWLIHMYIHIHTHTHTHTHTYTLYIYIYIQYRLDTCMTPRIYEGWPEISWRLQVSWDRDLALSWADDSTLKLWDLKAGLWLETCDQLWLASTKSVIVTDNVEEHGVSELVHQCCW